MIPIFLFGDAVIPAWGPVYDPAFSVYFEVELTLFELDICRIVTDAVAERVPVSAETEAHTRVGYQTRTGIDIDCIVIGKFVGGIGVAYRLNECIDILSYPAIVSLYELLMWGTAAEK